MMKPLLTAFAFTGLFYSHCFAQANSPDGRKHYPIKSCRIVFRFFNGPQRGTKTIIFDDWGNKEKEVVETMTDTTAMRKAMAGVADSLRNHGTPAFPDNLQFAPVQHNLKITVEGQSYSMDLDRHLGVKSPARLLFGGSFEENFKQMGFAFVRTDTLLGRPCGVWERPQSFRLWVWKGFYVVKKQLVANMPPGMRVEEYATEIDESYSIKPDEFKIPDNIQFQ